jgi:CRISPR-associated protein Cas1
MANLYLTEQGAVLHKTGERLVVTKGECTLLDVPCHEIDAVLIFGNVHVTTQAVRTLMEHGIEMALLTRRGKLLCQLTPPMAKNVLLRLAQYQRTQDKAFCLATARAIVAAKIASGLQFIRQHTSNYRGQSMAQELRELQRCSERVDATADTSALFGIEGNAARVYFQAFGKMLRSGIEFPGRRKRPAPDPVNALLSFGYTLLFNEIASLLDGIGFDPFIGFYHRPEYGRPSLAADLVEEFRVPVIDRLTVRLLNTRVFDADDFAPHAASGSLYLKRESLRKYFTAYEDFLGAVQTEAPPGAVTAESVLAQPRDPPAAGQKVGQSAGTKPRQPPHYRRLFRQQAQGFGAALTGGAPYVPYVLGESGR